jgi:hypothetical protein
LNILLKPIEKDIQNLKWLISDLEINTSEMEIIAWDSSYTIVKFAEKKMSDKFKEYFDEAIDVE